MIRTYRCWWTSVRSLKSCIVAVTEAGVSFLLFLVLSLAGLCIRDVHKVGHHRSWADIHCVCAVLLFRSLGNQTLIKGIQLSISFTFDSFFSFTLNWLMVPNWCDYFILSKVFRLANGSKAIIVVSNFFFGALNLLGIDNGWIDCISTTHVASRNLLRLNFHLSGRWRTDHCLVHCLCLVIITLNRRTLNSLELSLITFLQLLWLCNDFTLAHQTNRAHMVLDKRVRMRVLFLNLMHSSFKDNVTGTHATVLRPLCMSDCISCRVGSNSNHIFCSMRGQSTSSASTRTNCCVNEFQRDSLLHIYALFLLLLPYHFSLNLQRVFFEKQWI